MITRLDEEKKEAEHSYITKDKFDGAPDWYQQMVALSAQGKCAHLLYSKTSQPQKNEHEQKYCVIVDHEKKYDIRFFRGDRVYLAKTIDQTKNSLVDCLCLDRDANWILKIDGGIAYIASTNCNKVVKIDNDYFCAGALSLEGSYAITGGASGEISFHCLDRGDGFSSSIPSPEPNTQGTSTRFNPSLHKFIPNNPQDIIALATNEDGRYIAAARSNGHIDYYENEAEAIIADINSCSFDALDMLSSALEPNHKKSRPKNISTIYSDLPVWIQNFATKSLNVRAGWGPRATWNLMQNKNVPFKYKCEAVAPYIGGSIAVVIGGYYALKQWFNH